MVVADGDPVVLVQTADGKLMAAKITVPADGDPVAIIQGADGKQIGIAPDICEINLCDPDPEVLATVTGTTGTINWCGETWVLPGDSGVEKIICPTSYAHYTQYTSIYSQQALHSWKYVQTLSLLDLTLRRDFNVGSPLLLDKYNRISLDGSNWGIKRVTQFSPGSPTSYFNTTVVPTTFAFPLGDAMPTLANYDITDNFFFSHTIGGVTYSWARGLGWP